jgi:glucosamine-6-phosphate deaminase
MLSRVEKVFLERSKLAERYAPLERAVSVEVSNIYELGRIVALRFIVWVADNPNGVVALPTGRTPEYFIKTLELLKEGWTTESVKADLIRDGVQYTDKFPDMSGLTFVM